jgi:hypothetical protein
MHFNPCQYCRRLWSSRIPVIWSVYPYWAGSASELEYHLLLAADLDFITKSDRKKLMSKITEIKRMLTSLIQKLKAVR